MLEPLLRTIERMQHRLRHAVMYQRHDGALLRGIKRISRTRAEVIGQAALDAVYGVKAARVRDIGRLGGPRRNGPEPGHHQQQTSLFGDVRRRRTVGQQTIENLALRRLQRCFELREMPVFGGYPGDGRYRFLDSLDQLVETEFRQGVASAQRQKVWHLGIGESGKRNYSVPLV